MRPEPKCGILERKRRRLDVMEKGLTSPALSGGHKAPIEKEGGG